MDDEAYGSVEFRDKRIGSVFLLWSQSFSVPISEEQILAIALEWEAALER